AEDIRPPRHREPVVQAGKRLTSKVIERLQELSIEKIPVKAEHLEGRRTAGKVVDRQTGEVILEPNQELTREVLTQLGAKTAAPFKVISVAPEKNDASVYETLARDVHKNPDEALVEMYRRLRPGDPPTVESARALFRGMFLDPRRYDLARVGRFMLNKKLNMESPLAWKTL